jgi:TIR domain/SIR2-like domain
MTKDPLTTEVAPELWNDNVWDRLLEYLHEQSVIPIVGPDLLQVEIDGETILVDQHIARRLAQKSQLPEGDLPAEKPLNYVVCQLLRLAKDRDSICDDIFQIMKEANFQPSKPLRQLAEITDFNLFVSTTFDTLLEKAINEVRFGNTQGTLSIAYSPNRVVDLPSTKAKLARPTVFYLMGKLSANPSYVISDEDLLEHVCELQSPSRRPEMLFDELKKNHLLILGANFSDWLARIFLRTAKGERLSATHGFEILADNNTHRDRSLVSFLLHFSSRTRVFRAGGIAGGAVEFVDELWKRWSKLRPQSPPTSENPARDEMPRNAIFISYAREDLAAVQQLNAGLEAAGLPVWFDNERLGPGDNWSPQIEQYISRGCGCFVAVISKNTEKRQEGFFRREWKLAVDRDKGFHFGKKFIVPIVVDDTVMPDAVPLRFSELNYTWLPGGKVTPPFVQELRKIVSGS